MDCLWCGEEYVVPANEQHIHTCPPATGRDLPPPMECVICGERFLVTEIDRHVHTEPPMSGFEAETNRLYAELERKHAGPHHAQREFQTMYGQITGRVTGPKRLPPAPIDDPYAEIRARAAQGKARPGW